MIPITDRTTVIAHQPRFIGTLILLISDSVGVCIRASVGSTSSRFRGTGVHIICDAIFILVLGAHVNRFANENSERCSNHLVIYMSIVRGSIEITKACLLYTSPSPRD